MTNLRLEIDWFATRLVWAGAFLALSMAAAVIVARAVFAYNLFRRLRIERHYLPIVKRALDGSDEARAELVASPSRHRIPIAYLMIVPLIAAPDAQRIARARDLFHAMSLMPVAERLLRSRRWPQRALALRALGVLQDTTHTAAILAALDDGHAEVRGAALDALADLQDPATLAACVVRMHDASLHPGRRGAVIAAFGSRCEAFVLDLAEVDSANRLDYARTLAICGTTRSRPALCRWTQDPSVDVRVAAFEALAHVGLDERAAALAIEALESSEVEVRAMAAHSFHDWSGAGNEAASRLARHLDDAWPVAVQAARSLQTWRDIGSAALQSAASRPDPAGALARQTLWEATVR